MQDMPYFMENPEWYLFDGVKFVLTDKAPKEAEDSYEKFYEAEEKIRNG